MAKPSRQDEMVEIGTKRLQEMLSSIPKNQEEVAERIGLSKGGLYHAFYKSGRLHIFAWVKFRNLYKTQTKKNPQVDEKGFQEIQKLAKARAENPDFHKKTTKNEGSTILKLSDIPLESLISEIRKRGGRVTFD